MLCSHTRDKRGGGFEATADGLPYLVMEYVAGQPIDQFVADARLSILGRLEVFLNVCEAVSYAHHHGAAIGPELLSMLGPDRSTNVQNGFVC